MILKRRNMGSKTKSISRSTVICLFMEHTVVWKLYAYNDPEMLKYFWIFRNLIEKAYAFMRHLAFYLPPTRWFSKFWFCGKCVARDLCYYAGQKEKLSRGFIRFALWRLSMATHHIAQLKTSLSVFSAIHPFHGFPHLCHESKGFGFRSQGWTSNSWLATVAKLPRLLPPRIEWHVNWSAHLIN